MNRTPKIFGIGLHKTGTTTLARMMERMGYMNYGFDRYFMRLMFEGNFDPVWSWIAPWQSFQDIPWPLFYRELDQKYPGSKFILTLRDEEKWWNSLVNHFGGRITEANHLIFGFADVVGHKEEVLKMYRNHNREVQEYFADRPDDLLVVNWEDQGISEVCHFLGRPVPLNRFTGQQIAAGRHNTATQRSQRSAPEVFFRRKIKIRGKKMVVDLLGNSGLSLFNQIRLVRYGIRRMYLSLIYRTS